MLSVLNKHRYKIIAAVVIVVILCVAWTVGGGYAKDGADGGKDTTMRITSGDGSGNDTNANGNAGDSNNTDSSNNGNDNSADNGIGANNAAGATDTSNGQQNDAAQSGGNAVESATPVPGHGSNENGTEASQGTDSDNSVEQVPKEGDGTASGEQSAVNQTPSGSTQTPVASATPTPTDASSQAPQSTTDTSQQSQQPPQSTSPAENSTAQNSGIIQNSDSETDKGAYNTNPIPDGKPAPVEPQDAKISDTALTCTISVRCDTILNNMKYLNREKHELVPEDGWILTPVTVTFYEGESVFNVLQREMRRARIHLEFSNVPIYNSAYIEGINNLYEFDVGELSGWMYKVNDWFPNFGSSRYQLMDGDVIAWVYTCDLGEDVGGGYAVGNR